MVSLRYVLMSNECKEFNQPLEKWNVSKVINYNTKNIGM